MSKQLVVKNSNKNWLTPIIWVLAIMMAVSYLMSSFGGIIANAFNWDVGQNWRETVSTDNGIKGKVNGGLSEKEIEEFVEESIHKPFYEDIFRNAVVAESQNYVTIYRQIAGTSDFYNLNFVKTPKGLVYDGSVGVQTTGIKVNWLTGKRNFTNAKTTLNNELVAYVDKNQNWFDFAVSVLTMPFMFNFDGTENIVTFSDFKTNFAPGFDKVNWAVGLATNNKAKAQLFDYITYWLANNVMQPHFQSLTDNLNDVSVELINGIENIENPEVIKQRLNTFATYLWENARTADGSEKQTIIDVSKYYGSFIPTELQNNYPLQGEDIEKFAGFENYPMYDNKVFFDVSYMRNDIEPNRNEKTISKDADVIKDSAKIEQNRPKQTETYTRLNINLNNKTNSSITNEVLEDNPVVITIGDRTVVFDNQEKISSGASIALLANQTYYYEINSKELMFDSLSGSISVAFSESLKTFDFSYIENYIVNEMFLMPGTSSVPGSANLTKFPVKIIFTGLNNEGTYEVIFDKNYHLGGVTGVSVLMPAGEYEYTILSGQLTFAPSGTILVNSDNRKYYFIYAVDNTETYDVNVYANIRFSLEKEVPNHDFKISFGFGEGSLQVFNYLGKYKASINLFENNVLLQGFEKNIFSEYDSPSIFNIDQSVFINKNNLKLQLIFTSIEDPTKSILVNAVDLTFQNDSLGYETYIDLSVSVN